MIVNAGAIRETDPDRACSAADPVGPDNVTWIRAMIPSCQLHIAGWGSNAARFGGDAIVRQLFAEAGVALHALKLNRDGSPRHPLYVSYEAEPFPI